MKTIITFLHHFVFQRFISAQTRFFSEIGIPLDKNVRSIKTEDRSSSLISILQRFLSTGIIVPTLILLLVAISTELKHNPDDWSWSFIYFPICLGVVFQSIALLENKIRRIILGLSVFIPVLFLSTLERIAYNFSYDGFNLAFFIHGNIRDIWHYSTLEQKFIIATILTGIILVSIWSGFIFAKKPAAKITGPTKWITMTAGIMVLFLSGLFPSAPHRLIEFMYADLISNTKQYTNAELHALGIKPWEGTLKVTAPLKKNLIWIILESTDSSFFDETLYPDMMPNLQRLKDEGLVFDNLTMCRNAGFSVGGNFAAMTGECLMVSEIKQELAPSVNTIHIIEHDTIITISLPGILKECGYHQEFRASFNPGSENPHPFINLGFDHSEVCSNGTDWGISDEEILDRTYHRFLTTPEPFNLVTCTVDTHGNCGRRHKNTTRWYDKNGQYNKYMSVFNYNDKLIEEFINKLKKSPRWKNTIVVFTSDHYLYGGSRIGVSDDKTSKRLTFFVVNCGQTGTIHTRGKTFDIAPTILDLMEIKHNYVFPLGESLVRYPNPTRLNETPAQLDAFKFYIKTR